MFYVIETTGKYDYYGPMTTTTKFDTLEEAQASRDRTLAGMTYPQNADIVIAQAL